MKNKEYFYLIKANEQELEIDLPFDRNLLGDILFISDSIKSNSYLEFYKFCENENAYFPIFNPNINQIHKIDIALNQYSFIPDDMLLGKKFKIKLNQIQDNNLKIYFTISS